MSESALLKIFVYLNLCIAKLSYGVQARKTNIIAHSNRVKNAY